MEYVTARIERATNVLLVLAAVVATATALHREFFATPLRAAPPLGGPPTLEARWTEAQQHGVRIGSTGARVLIVEFADFQCPACRGFHSDLRRVLAQHPDDVAALLVPFPLPGHEHAVDAAMASSCAAAQGRAASMSDSLFSQQDSLGRKSWKAFAAEAGVADLAAFERCRADETVRKRVDDARAFGVSMQIPGTPTVIINGWRFTYPPRGEELDRAVANALRGRRPQDAD